ncbi:MAG: hypothetical protein QM725_00405 [Lacibacter sp.]
MKKYLILPGLLITLFAVTIRAEEKPKFYMAYSIECDPAIKFSVQDKLFQLENTIAYKLQENFPCINLKTQNSVHQRLDDLRKICLLNDLPTEDIQKSLTEIGSDVNCDYLVHIRMKVFTGNQVMVTCKVMNAKNSKVLANAISSGNLAGFGAKQGEEMAKKIIDDLKNEEICPYEGKVTIEIESEKEETTSNSAICDNGIITTEIKIKSKSDLKWELNKNGLRKGNGDVSYDLNENTEITINNPCYICPNGQKTIAQINEKKDVEAKANGLSNESVSKGQKVADCRIKIVFLEDGTYNILVEATSQKGNMKTTVDKKVNAPCALGNEEKPEEPRNNEIEVPLKVVLGPYKGTTKDKVLSQEETKDLSQGKEKTTVKINFSLTRQ